jgi:hypothetical protein
MKKLLLVLLAFLAVITYIRAYETAEISETPAENSVEISR